MSSLLLLIVAVLFGLYWLNSNHARVNAIEAARRHCAQLGFQFLDGSVALDKTRPERVNGGFIASNMPTNRCNAGPDMSLSAYLTGPGFKWILPAWEIKLTITKGLVMRTQNPARKCGI